VAVCSSVVKLLQSKQTAAETNCSGKYKTAFKRVRLLKDGKEKGRKFREVIFLKYLYPGSEQHSMYSD
jgi:hypothetical protein